MNNKQDMLKIQTCVLRVNIHCEGCKHKVKKTLQKVEGVYKVSIDVEQGKVSVSGNVDPLLLIQKLEKSGKHAEFWGPQKGPPISILSSHNQLKNTQFGNMKESKSQKGGAQQIPQQLLMMMNQKKGLKDERFMGKDPKSVKFKLPEEDEDEDDFDDDDEFDDDEFDDDSEFDDDEFDEGFGAHQPPSKVAPIGGGAKVKKSGSNDEAKGKKKGGKEKEKKGGKEKEKKGGGGGIGIDMLLKGIMGKGGGKNGKKGEKEKKKGDGGKDGKKNDGFALGNGKNGGTKGHGAPNNGSGKKSNDGWGKKGGDSFDGGMKLESKQHGFNVLNAGHKGSGGGGGGGGGGHKGGGGGGGGGGRNMDGMGQMGNFPAVQGLPATPGMNPMGRFQGMGMGPGPGNNPYNQQQMAHMMMMMNQQREHGHDAYNPMAFTRPQPTMGYGPPPPGTDQYTHMFSDENTDSCSIM